MTNANRMDMIVVLDRSGSMSFIVEQTISGFNTYVNNQKTQPGDNRLTLIQFDDQYEPVYVNMPVNTVPQLTSVTFVPRGMTALLDAIGRTITERGAVYAAMPESDRPAKVVLVIITDGMENASKEYTRQRVFDMIKHQQDKYDWGILYLGANQDAIATGASLGVRSGMAVNYTSSPTGAKASFGAAANYSNTVRGCTGQSIGSLNVDPDDVANLAADKPVDIRP